MEHYIESEHVLHILIIYVGFPDHYVTRKYVTPAQTGGGISKVHNRVQIKYVKLGNSGNSILAQKTNYMLCLDFYVKRYYKYVWHICGNLYK